MSPELILTGDGSHTLALGDGITYHSVFGAIQESRHIYIEAGLMPLLADQPGPSTAPSAGSNSGANSDSNSDSNSGADSRRSASQSPLRIFELGFGTGLNTLLTLIETVRTMRPVYYETIDIEPLSPTLVRQLNYCTLLSRPDLQTVFERLHAAPWGEEAEVAPAFRLRKTVGDGSLYRLSRPADLVYYDAFDPVVQPALWSEQVFSRLAAAMAPGAVLVTYSCKGTVRRALQAAGFKVEKLPGPPGKREFLRATLQHPNNP